MKNCFGGKHSTTQMNAFLIDGKLITDKNDMCDMWANHFEDLRKPSFDYDFFDRVATRVRNFFASCQNELPCTLNEPLQHQEVFKVIHFSTQMSSQSSTWEMTAQIKLDIT